MEAKRILLADDDSIIRMILETCLKDWGYEVTSVTDGLQAWDILQEDNCPNLAIIDWMMPGMDGVEVCKKIREQNKEPYIYIILLTAKSSPQDIIKGLETGADDYLVKPVAPQELKVRLRAGFRIVELQENLIQARNELKEIAIHDSLTSLFNRGWIFRTLENELARMNRENRPVSVIMTDIDHFKRVNDTYGHPAGDLVLHELGQRLSETFRRSDAVGRYGGEEFIVVLPGVTQNVSFHLAERLRNVISQTPFTITNSLLSISVSLGVSDNEGSPNLSSTDLIQAADKALYHAKKNGRNQTALAPPIE